MTIQERTKTATAEVTSECTCEDWDEDTDTYLPASTCSDFCHEHAEEWAAELVSDWLEAQDPNASEQVIIYGTRLGWRSLSGYKLAASEPLEIIRALYLNGDFTLRFSLSPENELTATRGSHDEYGACFEFAKVTVCSWSYCSEIEGISLDKYEQPACEFHREIASVN
jgi:hypothetical protein